MSQCVNWTYLTVYEASQREIKSRWESLLSKEPAWKSKGPPAELSSAMDIFLEELWSMLRSSNVTNLVNKVPPVALPVWSHDACRLNSTLVFLAIGKRAVRSIARRVEATQSDLPPDERIDQWSELMLTYDIVSQREIQRVCGACFRKAKCGLGGSPSGSRREGNSALHS